MTQDLVARQDGGTVMETAGARPMAAGSVEGKPPRRWLDVALTVVPWLRGEQVGVGDADLVIEPGEANLRRLREAIVVLAIRARDRAGRAPAP